MYEYSFPKMTPNIPKRDMFGVCFSLKTDCVIEVHIERIHLELEYSRVAVPFIVLTWTNFYL